MYKVFIVVIGVAMSSCTTEQQPILSGASYGSKESRIQFRKEGAEETKLSYNVGDFDNISGPTFLFKEISTNKDGGFTYHYTGMKDPSTTLLVDNISTDSVQTTFMHNGTQIVTDFTPRAVNLGRRPRD